MKALWWTRSPQGGFGIVRNGGDGCVHVSPDVAQRQPTKGKSGERKAYGHYGDVKRTPIEACVNCRRTKCAGGDGCFKRCTYAEFLEFQQLAREYGWDAPEKLGITERLAKDVLGNVYPGFAGQRIIKQILEARRKENDEENA